jgi:mannitol/fructose-specific phosphotransferase system IIA component (Ntr-type)
MVIRVSDALAAGGVLVRPEWDSYAATVSGLVEQLVSSGSLPGRLATEAVQRIHEREAVATTAMVDIGVSIPHARLDGINGIVAAMAVSPRAVYQVGDGLPISIVVLVLSSPTLVGEHLNFLASLSMLLQSARFRQRVRNAATAEEVQQLVRSNE